MGEMGDEAFLGVLFALFSALTVAIYFILNQRILRGHGGVTRGVVWILTSAGIILFILTQLTGQGIGLNAIGDAWAVLLLFGVCGTSFSVYMLNLGIQRLGAARAAVVATFRADLCPLLRLGAHGGNIKATAIFGRRVDHVQRRAADLAAVSA